MVSPWYDLCNGLCIRPFGQQYEGQQAFLAQKVWCMVIFALSKTHLSQDKIDKVVDRRVEMTLKYSISRSIDDADFRHYASLMTKLVRNWLAYSTV